MIGRDAGRTLWLAGLGAAATLLCGFLAAGGAQAGPPAFELKRIGTFKDPVHADNAPGADNLFFVVEQRGRIVVLKNERERKQPFLDARDIVGYGGEQGLLSVAFHPDYDTNRRLYVYYVDNGGDIRIDQFKRRAKDPLRAGLRSRKKVITIQHNQAPNHNGGQLQFGPDGYLYAAVGDGGPQEDPENDSQTTDNLLGKLIRIDPLAAGSYAVPADNPYAEKAGADEIFAIGLRNPWRFSFDSVTGALTLADVGGGEQEEVNYLSGASPGLGANFGWNDYEGFEETGFGTGENASPHTAPIADFSHGNPDNFCSIAGGYVVNDPGLPALAGDYIFSDLCQSEVFAIDVPAGTPSGVDPGVSGDNIVSFAEGAGNQIYVVDLNGPVSRLEQE
jgi:glucose/arabinose dehydrogenase